MLSARAIYNQIRDNDETYALFLSVAEAGETQGGWENLRIAELTPDPVLAGKIERHGHDESKHGRLFAALLRKRNLDAVPLPEDADYAALLEARGVGISHERLAKDEPLSDEEVIRALVHSRVTEQRAHEEVEMQREIFGADPELGKAVRLICEDEINHLSYSHEELMRLCEAGHEPMIRPMLREVALIEIRTYREVSLAVMGHMAERLGWPALKTALLRLGIHAIWAWERLWGWRRMATLKTPPRLNAMDPAKAPAEAPV